MVVVEMVVIKKTNAMVIISFVFIFVILLAANTEITLSVNSLDHPHTLDVTTAESKALSRSAASSNSGVSTHDTGSRRSPQQTSTTPIVTILNPLDGETVGDTVTIRFNASSDSEITTFELYLNGTKVPSSEIQIYSDFSTYYWEEIDSLGPETYNITVRAQDADGDWGEATHFVDVDPQYMSGVVKILNYNILETGLNPEWLDVMKEENPDIAILIETGSWVGGNDPQLQQVVSTLNSYFNDEKPYMAAATRLEHSSTAGEALLSRYPIVNFTEFLYASLDNGTKIRLHHSVYDAVVEIAEVDVHIIAVHLACCSGGEQRRERDMEALINYMDSLGPVPILFAGDFNSFSPYDTGDLAPIPGNLGSEPINMLLNKSNPHASTVHTWYDTFRELNPYDPGYTYIDNIYKSRIDFIFANSFFYDKFVNATVGDTPSADVGSDHFPVDVTLNFDAPEIDLRPPYPPTGVSATIINESFVSLSWDPNNESDLSHYVVYRNDEKIGETNSTSFNDSTAQPNVVYWYQVTAVDNSSNEGFKSHKVYLNTTYGIITVPKPPKVTVASNVGEVTLTWEVIDNGGLPVLYYNIYRQSYGRFIKIGQTKEPTFTDKNVVAGKTYIYAITAINELGESNYSESITVTVTAAPTSSEPSNKKSDWNTGFSMFSLGLLAVTVLLYRQRRKNKK